MKLILKIWLVASLGLFIGACNEAADAELDGLDEVSNKPETSKVNTELGTVVRVTGGDIQGHAREEGLREYLGIPYAAAPIGDKRWQPPHPLASWQSVRQATERGLPCVQPASLSEFYDRAYVETSEDCLTLNVWTRAQQSSERLPVMVWVHGGALVMGSGRDYDGASLTSNGVVLVTLNYRLGPFGFFAHPELSIESPQGSSGNQGYRDQIAALTWVQNNIEQFGGDPDNVTIFGESAGSWSMSVLQASPLAQGLFHKVIGQSGARFIPLSDLSKPRWGLPSGEAWGQQVASMLTGTEAPDLVALRALPAQQIMDIYAGDPAVLNNFDRLTIVDGDVLPDEVNAIFAKGEQADVPVLIGSNADEATTFDPAMLNPGGDSPDYVSAHEQLVARTLPTVGNEIFDLYPATADAARDSFVRFNTDAMFTQPMRLWADYMEGVSSPAYLYWWNWRPMIDGSDQYGAFHAAEIPYVFNDLSMFDIEDSEQEREFSETMMTLWTNFAKTGDPSAEGVVQWPAYQTAKPAVAILGPNIEVVQGIRSEEVEVITAAYAQMRE
jgi:para-nitrobenzyl esterase